MYPKKTNLISFALVMCAIVFSVQSCSENKPVSEDASNTSQTTRGVGSDSASPNANVNPDANAQPLAQPQMQPAAQNQQTAGVKHYTCPNNCPGSGGDAQGNCPVCNTAYVHNDAFHQQPGQETPSIQQTPPSMQLNPQNSSTPQINPQTPPAPEASPTNARGEYHYTCSAGHAGGSGSAGKCASCGKDLVHNDNYHK